LESLLVCDEPKLTSLVERLRFDRTIVDSGKLFLMDFLNYYTWFFLLAFVYVIPGAGDIITNFLNTVLWKYEPNCCFGPYLDPLKKKKNSTQLYNTCPNYT
jgi:hypothetical protein